MRRVDTSVNDVGTGTSTGARVVNVAARARLVGKARNSPGSAGLGREGVDAHDGILLDELDLRNS